MYIRFIQVFLVSLLMMLGAVKDLHAGNEFSVRSDIEYKVDEDGNAGVTNKIKITNEKSEIFPKGYQLSFSKYKPLNLKVYEDARILGTTFSESEDRYNYLINFENEDVGISTTKTFLITYQLNDIVVKTGEVWEINIPKQENIDNFLEYKVSVVVPKSFGKANFLSVKPKLITSKDSYSTYLFSEKDLFNENIYISFGDFQTYDFDITYHLENPLEKTSYSEIAIIPDTTFQKVFYKNIEPKPNNIYIDQDGNWIAQFVFKPREVIDIKTKGFVQIFSSPVNNFEIQDEYLKKNTLPDLFWETTDVTLTKIAQNLSTPKQIYDYELSELKYDKTKLENYKFERFGAKKTIENPTQSLCTEFTDTFVTLARINNIPAREINGFAFTDDPITKPLTLVNDILHSWPEYFSYEKNYWIPIDPTWGKTSGQNYFDNFDMKHIVFAIHGASSTLPYSAGTYKLGPNPQKDVIVGLATKPPEKSPEKLDISYKSLGKFSPFKETIEISVTNGGSQALYNITSDATFSGQSLSDNSNIKVLLPYATYKYNLEVPFTFLGLGMSNEIVLNINNNVINIQIHKTTHIITHIIFVFIVFSAALSLIINKLRHFLKKPLLK